MNLSLTATLFSITGKLVYFLLTIPILPIAIREATVNDRISRLRKMIFLAVITSMIVNGVMLFIQSALFFHQEFQFFLHYLAILNTCATIVIGIILNLIYTKRYK